MIKPLLRVIPKLSGNVKLACNLFDLKKINNDIDNTIFEANIRYAKLLPLSSHIFQKKIDAGLLGSCWNFDLKKFYDTYRDIFYNNCFTFSKQNILELDKTKNQYIRNTDMEFGVKRISYSRNGAQFAMFAPFYIDDVKDIPSYFLLSINFSNGIYKTTKSIKINIAANAESKYNYIFKYLKKYVEQIDDNVLFCQPENNQGIYYGIDVRNGGFVKAIDNTIGNIYNVQNTIHNVDSLVTRGFERNKIAMKQIIPLAFYFNINDLLTENELRRYKNQIVTFSGAYYTTKNKKLPFYDFSIDYDEFSQQVLKMHKDYGYLTYQNGEVNNIMDVPFPSLNEARYINYQFANKLSADFCRWKLKYSDDEHPYVLNMSSAFSKNANSSYRYGEFPVVFSQLEGLCNYVKLLEHSDYQYNLIFPFSTNKEEYDKYDYRISLEYERIMNQFCLNWFNTIDDDNYSIFNNESIWRDVKDDCVYYNGILYDLQNIYNTKENPDKVDKFAVLIKPEPDILTAYELAKLKTANYTLYRRSNSNISQSNVIANDDMINQYIDSYSTYLYSGETFDNASLSYFNIINDVTTYSWELNNKNYSDKLVSNEIFTYNSYGNGYFVDISETGLDYHEINKYYSYEDFKRFVKNFDAYLIQTINEQNNKIADEIDKSIKEQIDYIKGINHIKGINPDIDANEISVNTVNAYELISYDYISNIKKSNIEKYISYSQTFDAFVNIPIYKSKTINYSYIAYISDLIDTYTYAENEIGYTYNNYAYDAFNSYILNIPETYSQDEYFSAYTYYRTFDDYLNKFTNTTSYEIDCAAYFPEICPLNNKNESHTYVVGGNKEYADGLYGNNFYVKNTLIRSYLNNYVNLCINTDFNSSERLKNYIDTAYSYELEKQYTYSYWSYADILNSYNYDDNGNVINAYAYSCLLYKALKNVKKQLNKNVIDYANSYIENGLTEFEFLPLSEYNNKVYAKDTFKERNRNSYTAWFYGDNIPFNKIHKDVDVLWADMYNLQNVFKKYAHTDLIDDENTTKTFFIKFLNKEHVYYYYDELFKDKNMQYKYNVDYILTDKIRNKAGILEDEKNLFTDSCYYYDSNNLRRYSEGLNFSIESSENFYDWYNKDWYTTIYKKKKVWIYDKNYSSYPVVKLIYENIGERTFSEWYNKLNYDSENDLFYEKITKTYNKINYEYNEYFELVFTKKMYRVDKNLWDITDIENNTNDIYRDIYFYRIQRPEEYDSKYAGILSTKFIGDVKSYKAERFGSDANNISDEIISEDGQLLFKIAEQDTELIPMFNDIYVQPESEAQIVAHYRLNNINVCNIQPDEEFNNKYASIIADEKDCEKAYNLLVNYRYNRPDKNLMIKLSTEERENLKNKLAKENIDLRTWDIYSNTYSNLVVNDKYNDLDYKNSYFNTYIDEATGIKYGFYLIYSKFNNTSDSFRLTGKNINNEYVFNLKAVNSINGVNLLSLTKDELQNYITNIYKQLSPFINLNPLNTLSSINTIIYPKNYYLNLRYSQYLNNALNNAKEMDIKKHDMILKKLYLLRYMHNMTPLITETNTIKNEYKLKLKNVKASLLDTGRYNSIGDSTMYKEDALIIGKKPIKVYGVSDNKTIKNYNNVVEKYLPLEYKHFNASKMVNLEERFEIMSTKKYKYSELLEAQSDEVTRSIFKNYLNKGHINQFDDNDILFLINKYNVEYDSTPVGLTLDKSEKLYTLKYIFTLL